MLMHVLDERIVRPDVVELLAVLEMASNMHHTLIPVSPRVRGVCECALRTITKQANCCGWRSSRSKVRQTMANPKIPLLNRKVYFTAGIHELAGKVIVVLDLI
jgi:hypothetical protein